MGYVSFLLSFQKIIDPSPSEQIHLQSESKDLSPWWNCHVTLNEPLSIWKDADWRQPKNELAGGGNWRLPLGMTSAVNMDMRAQWETAHI